MSALQGGRLLPDRLLAEMRKPHPKSESHFGRYGLGQYMKDTGPDCVGTVLSHNGGVNGYGSLMYSTPDGSRTLTASITAGDAAVDLAKFPKALDRVVRAAFCAGTPQRNPG
jgi:D-alanyl-D-alanine carboxypeptidase